MLVLSRKKDQSIVIAENITVTVLHCCGSTIRLGITAPDEMKIVRSELISEKKGGDNVEVGRGSPTLAVGSGSKSTEQERETEYSRNCPGHCETATI